jgi:hypothetical protein
MASSQTLLVSLILPYTQAGVDFHLTGHYQAEHTATVAITAQPAGGGAPLALQAPATPVLEDFASGFTRWLRTCRITADLTAAGIRGQMPADATTAQLLEAMGRASDMIDQRFSLYTESILT